ncbi:MAG: hypothetical protein QXV97_04320 [Candidatus Caldarchaeum sp.]
MKTVYVACFAACFLVLLALTLPEMRLELLSAASAIALLASASMYHGLKIVHKPAGWPQSRPTLITLGVLASACFISTTLNAYIAMPTIYILAIFAVNTYLTMRLVAEAFTYMKTDAGLAVSALVLGLLAYLVYSISFLEALRG